MAGRSLSASRTRPASAVAVGAAAPRVFRAQSPLPSARRTLGQVLLPLAAFCPRTRINKGKESREEMMENREKGGA